MGLNSNQGFIASMKADWIPNVEIGMVIVVLEAGPAQMLKIAWKHHNPAVESLFNLGIVVALWDLSFLRCAVVEEFRLVANGIHRTPAIPRLSCTRIGALHRLKILELCLPESQCHKDNQNYQNYPLRELYPLCESKK